MRLIAVTVAAVVAGALAGCTMAGAQTSDADGTSRLDVIRVNTGDRTVTCVVSTEKNIGGVSCDWAGAVKP